ncbi:hypothetical protein AB2M62_01125 [Sphingomonas sp. MMS12-HWE2-04]|uniref:hypothetical protein n=1 Tax=Sphingomonas sp. MMS12-HWE2-04 TaxID=3234199 RepID=UPI0038505501
MRVWLLAPTLALGLSACGGDIIPARPASAGHIPVPSNAPPPPPNIAAIKGQTAPRLVAQFGTPALDMSEGSARKLQFMGPICVLDAYLYPPSSGRGEPTVTWLDTRQRDGSPIDPASCVAALTRRQ